MMAFLTPDQASLAISVIQLAFTFVLLPTVLDPRAQVPRKSSVSTAVGLYGIAFVYAGLDLWLACAMALLAAVMWTAVAILRPVKVG